MGGPFGAIGGKAAANKTENTSQRHLNTGNLGSSYSDIENLLLPYDELVAMGRVVPGEDAVNTGYSPGETSFLNRFGANIPASRSATAGYEGLAGNESRFSRGLSAYFGNLAASDPAFGAYQREMGNNLNFDENGLPADVSRGILQGVRSSSSSRGLLDSGTAGLEEVAALMGGRESLRSSRLAQVNQYLSGPVFQGAIQSLFPGIGTVYTGELQRAEARADATQEAGKVGVGILGAS